MTSEVDPLDFLADGEVPRFFTIAEARLRQRDCLEHLPVLGADGYIVKGWTHLLAGWWRLGKSELIAAVVAPWLRMGLRVLWITEEPDSLWADRADTFDEIYEPVPWDRLTLLDAMSAPAAALLDRVVDSVAGREADVIIADTIREVCGIETMKDDDAIRRAVSPWLRRLRDGRRTLIFLAQHRKAAGESGERVEGSVALPSMMDAVLELATVDGYDRRRRLTVRRRGSQVTPLVYEMDEDERLVVIPDARSRGRVETEAGAVFVVNESAEPLTSAAVRRQMDPRPSRDALRRALTAAARAGRIVRNPPITEDAGRRTVTWQSPAGAQLNLAQHSIPPTWEFGAPDGAAPDSPASVALTSRAL